MSLRPHAPAAARPPSARLAAVLAAGVRACTGARDGRLDVVEENGGVVGQKFNKAAKESANMLEEIKTTINSEDFKNTPENLEKLRQFEKDLAELKSIWSKIRDRYDYAGGYGQMVFMVSLQLNVVEVRIADVKRVKEAFLEEEQQKQPDSAGKATA